MAKQTTTLQNMAVGTLSVPSTVSKSLKIKSPSTAVPTAAITMDSPQTLTFDSARQITKRVVEALEQTNTITVNNSHTAGQMSLVALEALDCIVVEGYKESFSFFNEQTQLPFQNANIIDPQILKRENTQTPPSNQFPDVDTVFYELDEGKTINEQRATFAMDVNKQKSLDLIVADIVNESFSPNQQTLKQIAATDLNVMPPAPKAAPKDSKKIQTAQVKKTQSSKATVSASTKVAKAPATSVATKSVATTTPATTKSVATKTPATTKVAKSAPKAMTTKKISRRIKKY
tara:strand:- start:2712 stop:3578 length:867 start_codon:yes stop_codon:yes gene_type:complete